MKSAPTVLSILSYFKILGGYQVFSGQVLPILSSNVIAFAKFVDVPSFNSVDAIILSLSSELIIRLIRLACC